MIDIGLSTNNLEQMLRFWQEDAGLHFDHVLPVCRDEKQHRHDAMGSVVKLNHYREPLPAAPPSGYHELVIAGEGVKAPRRVATSAVVILSLLFNRATADPELGVGTPDEFRIGSVMPYTGPLAPFASIGRTEAAYFPDVRAPAQEKEISGCLIISSDL